MRVLGVTAVVVIAGCGLPCASSDDCITGYVCVEQRCAPPTSAETDGGGGISGGASSSGGGSSGTSGSSGSSSSSGGSGNGGCPRPVLLAMLSSNDTGAHGQVRRYSLAGGTAQECTALRAGDSLSYDLRAVGVAGNYVVVGQPGGLRALDPETDTVAWTDDLNTSTDDYPLNVFPMMAPDSTGTLVPAAGVVLALYFNDLTPRTFKIVKASSGAELHRWKTDDSSSPLYLGNSGTNHALRPGTDDELLLARYSGDVIQSVELPYDGNARRTSAWVTSLPQGTPQSISTLVTGTTARAVVHTQGFSASDGIYQVTDDGTDRLTRGPYACTAHCPQPMDVLHAVPDPTQLDAVFAVCEVDNNTNHVVRTTLAGDCTLVLDGATLPTQVFPTRLAIQP